MDRHKHPSDADLLKLSDLELSQAQAESMQKHLGSCQKCRDRQERMQDTLSELNSLYSAELSEAGSLESVSRARLIQRLTLHQKTSSMWSFSGVPFRRSLVFAMLLVAVGAGISAWAGFERHNGISLQDAESASIPNRMLTPGAIRPVTLSELCTTTDDDLDPVVSVSMQSAVLQEYGVSAERPERSYQIDYLVNPQLGGTNDIKNLWPEPEHEGIWNARAKDELEKHLHQLVCARTIDLTVAQREIATNWIAAYKKYIRRETPA